MHILPILVVTDGGVPCAGLIHSGIQALHLFRCELEVVDLGILLDTRLGYGFGERYESL